MTITLLKYWDRLRSSFWFLPALMAGGAVLLASGTVALDETVAARGVEIPSWVYSGGAQGASTVLGAIAGSMITIAGVVFSMTLVALSIASSQLGPRLLQGFMRDATNQVVLGTFVSTFLYCLLVLRTIRREAEGAFVPHLAVSLGVLLAVVSVAVLIYFIHHVSLSIQADEVIARVCRDVFDGIDRLFPARIGHGRSPDTGEPGDAGLPVAFADEARAVAAEEDGYLQFVDAALLMTLATQADVIVRVERRPGHYVIAGSPLVLVWPAERADDRLAARIAAAFVMGTQRTPTQDVEFSLNQLVEIALRALSPGVNDPFTAITCVDRLGSALCRLARRESPSPFRRDGSGKLRLVATSTSFAGFADSALLQIRQAARTSAAVTIRLLETIAIVAAAAHRPEDRVALGRHAEMIARGARTGVVEEGDRRTVEDRFLTVSRALRAAPVPRP